MGNDLDEWGAEVRAAVHDLKMEVARGLGLFRLLDWLSALLRRGG